MALTYAETAALMTDAAFRDRTKIAIMHYASYIANDTAMAEDDPRKNWAQRTMMSPDPVVMQIIPTLVMDAQVQQDGSEITDALLQSSVETTLNKMAMW